jgi:hypothetical protein
MLYRSILGRNKMHGAWSKGIDEMTDIKRIYG